MDNKFFDDLGETLSRTAREFGERAESFYEKQKLRNQIILEERAAEKTFTDLGKAIYKRYSAGEEFDSKIEDLCKRIDQYYQKVEELKNTVAGKDGKKVCPSCGKTIDSDSLFCPACGMAYPQEEDDAEVVEGEVVHEEESSEDTEETSAAEPEENGETTQEPDASQEAEASEEASDETPREESAAEEETSDTQNEGCTGEAEEPEAADEAQEPEGKAPEEE
jgi:RNA polymerase subunit RPABC4/transcription elongation factor Spt4